MLSSKVTVSAVLATIAKFRYLKAGAVPEKINAAVVPHLPHSIK